MTGFKVTAEVIFNQGQELKGALMGEKLNPQEMELYRATDEVLHYIWDPIGISDEPNARDEYWSYLPRVFKLLTDETPNEVVVEYLLRIESERILHLLHYKILFDKVVKLPLYF